MPVRQIETKFYLFRQNNSGGHLLQDEDFDQFVVIEEINPKKAFKKLQDLGIEDHYSCPCCGDRWDSRPESEYSEVEHILQDSHFSIYDDFKIIIHFFDGTKSEIPSTEVTNLWNNFKSEGD